MCRWRVSIYLSIITLFLFLVSGILFAGVTGKIAGKVIDKETGDGLPGANVVVMGTTLGASADVDGNYFVLNVPTGTYTLQATFIGYTTVKISDVRVYADLTTEINFELSSTVLELGEEVAIVAERPLLQKDISSSTKITTDEQIMALPVTTVNEAIALNPGAQGSGNNLHLRGGRAGEVNYLVDGLSIEDPQVRSIGLQVGRSALSELQIISGGFNAEYGNAQSGIILLNTPEGSRSKYSGRFFYQTDHMGGGIGESSQHFDWFEASLGGPEPLTTYFLPKLGVRVPGYMTIFLQGEGRFTDRAGFHEDALADAKESPLLRTSNSLRNETIFGKLFGIGSNRESVRENWNTKLVWQMAPGRKLSIGWRGNDNNTHPWTFTHGLNIREAVTQAHQMGISDLIDQDGDGQFDEELLNGVDDDGDGLIDEDSRLADVTRYNGDFAWGIDNDGDGRVDEEALNEIDDDGDGLIDEDLQPYDWNGYDNYFRDERRATQLALNWTHTLSPNTFYEVKLARFYTFRGRLPKAGKDGVSRSSFDELEAWLNDFEAAQAEIEHAREAGEPVPKMEDLIEPYLGFGYPHEPFVDANGNGEYDPGEEFTDWDGDGLWDLNSDTENPIWIFRGENHPFRGQRFNGRYIFSDRSGFFKRISTIYTAKIDLTSQVTRHHQIKSGFELNFFNLENISRQLTGPFNGRGLFGNEYDVHPNWQAFYMQDKMEFRNAIVNLGLRVERFDQGDEVAEPDTSSPFIPRFEPPEAKWSVLPRIGFSFPVTEKDVFFFNYGRFFQRPQLTRVFNQVNQPIDSPNSIVGNPNLDPEETISYEFGIRHEFGLHTLLTITGFFKDIDNLLQINQQFDEVGNVFRTYFNDTYGTVKGFELNLIQRAGQFFSGEVSYTFQVAKTTHSTARRTYTRENIFAQLPGTEFPADWDQRHRFVFNIDYHYRKGEGPRIGNFYPLESWNMNILATIASGLPYTPEAFNGTPKFELTNTKRFPWTFDIDVRMRRFFDVVGLRLGAVIEIENLLNRRNAIGPDNGGIVDAFRDRIGFFNSGSPDGTRNFGGFENAVPDPRAWSNGRIIRLGFAIEY